ncbi:unnamed protein product [Anisakis simplex]|uniref:Hyaluronidase n=1 Tax=Anisakis simplex TaxID=6269 RepID=A0A3P6PZV0_ANISI|nr:unnamed protein product [Anisakis simplex]
MDFESWRPLWRLNWGSKRIYKSESVKWVKQRYPHISTKSARRMATQQFNKAALYSVFLLNVAIFQNFFF